MNLNLCETVPSAPTPAYEDSQRQGQGDYGVWRQPLKYVTGFFV